MILSQYELQNFLDFIDQLGSKSGSQECSNKWFGRYLKSKKKGAETFKSNCEFYSIRDLSIEN